MSATLNLLAGGPDIFVALGWNMETMRKISSYAGRSRQSYKAVCVCEEERSREVLLRLERSVSRNIQAGWLVLY